MKPLTDKEIDTFFKVVNGVTPLIESLLEQSKKIISEIMKFEMTDKTLVVLEVYIERRCFLYNLNKTCKELTKGNIYSNRSDEIVCKSVRNIINKGKNYYA